jgi:hypothetical protein
MSSALQRRGIKGALPRIYTDTVHYTVQTITRS